MELRYKKRKRMGKKDGGFRQGRPEAHCKICSHYATCTYDVGFGTRTQNVCGKFDKNIDSITLCDFFTTGEL